METGKTLELGRDDLARFKEDGVGGLLYDKTCPPVHLVTRSAKY